MINMLIRPEWVEIWRHIKLYKINKKSVFFGYGGKNKNKKGRSIIKEERYECIKNYLQQKIKLKLLMATKSRIANNFDVIVWDLLDIDYNKLKGVYPEQFRKKLYNKIYKKYDKHNLWFQISNPRMVKNGNKFLHRLRTFDENKPIFDKNKQRLTSRTPIYFIKKFNKIEYIKPYIIYPFIRIKIHNNIYKKLFNSIERVIKNFLNDCQKNPNRFLKEYEVQCELHRKLIEGLKSYILKYGLQILMESSLEFKQPKKKVDKSKWRYDINIYDSYNKDLISAIEIKFGDFKKGLVKIKEGIESDKKKLRAALEGSSYKLTRGYLIFFSNKYYYSKISELKNLSNKSIKVIPIQPKFKDVVNIITKYFSDVIE